MKKTIKHLLNTPNKTNIVMGAGNALLAEIAAKVGYDGVWISSFESHAWNLLPDANILNTADYFDTISKISDRIDIPILVDADEGGPSSINTIRMVREYEKAGASAMCFEDNPSPKRCSFYGMKQSLETSEIMCGKIRAAVEKRLNDDFAVIARTEALIQGHGQDVAIERARMYNDAGCDGFLIHSKSKTPDEVLKFADAYHKENLRAPLVCVPTTYNTVTVDELCDAGFSLAIYANCSVRATVRVIQEVFEKIKTEKTLSAVNEDIVPMETIFDLIRVDQLKDNQNRYGS
jgi:phosphoenolpyruvate phosphomutase|tara:strand:- start:512 stop:1384 length:873 start_codon:yes stop_codon:yes gene_type:complete